MLVCNAFNHHAVDRLPPPQWDRLMPPIAVEPVPSTVCQREPGLSRLARSSPAQPSLDSPAPLLPQVYVMSACFCAAMLAFSLWGYPETKGLSMEEVQL
jgi:hypothetical protein